MPSGPLGLGVLPITKPPPAQMRAALNGTVEDLGRVLERVSESFRGLKKALAQKDWEEVSNWSDLLSVGAGIASNRAVDAHEIVQGLRRAR